MKKIEWSREAIQAAWKAFNVASENPMKNALNAACEIQGIECLRAENEKLAALSAKASQELSLLRAALKPFADIAKQTEHWSGPPASVPLYVIRAAAAALKETGDE